MTDKEKEELQKMMEMGMLSPEDYAAMTGEVSAVDANVPLSQATPIIVPPMPEQNTASLPDIAEWYIAIDGKQQGPYAKVKLGEKLAANEITRQALVWKQGMAEWAVIEIVAELKDIFARLPPPLPPIAALATETIVSAASYNETVAPPSMEDRYQEARALYDNKNYVAAVPLLELLANEGYGSAQKDLGYCYKYGRGVLEDPAKAVEWYRKAAEWYHKAAEQGDVNAQGNLGDCYYNGKGVTQDYAKAVEWYRKAAEQGNVGAQSILGDCYYNGKGVTRDHAKAVEWYRKAVEQGDVVAKIQLDMLKREGRI